MPAVQAQIACPRRENQHARTLAQREPVVHSLLHESMRQYTIGTSPVLISGPNPKRLRFTFEFTPSSVIAGNTGLIFFGRGFIPNAVLNDPNQGDVLNAGASIEEVKSFDGDTRPYKGALWAVSDTADQIITYDEEVAA